MFKSVIAGILFKNLIFFFILFFWIEICLNCKKNLHAAKHSVILELLITCKMATYTHFGPSCIADFEEY